MRIVFMGTPDFAVGAFAAVLAAGHEVVLAVTQPDKAKGRSGQLSSPPVKCFAMENNIPVFQPEKIKRPEAVCELKKQNADIFIVAAFGQILSQEILDIPKYGCLNVHASLLPKYRGASPIQHVILNGEEKTGITIMQMNAGLDTGDILYQKECVISEQDTCISLEQTLAELGGVALVEALALLQDGKLIPKPQDDSQSCYSPLIRKEMGRIDFTKDSKTIDRLVRGMNPWPSAFTLWQGKQLKIWMASALSIDTRNARPGEVVAVTKEDFTVATGDGALVVKEVQLEGKKRMSCRDFLLGVKVKEGDLLGVR